MASFNSENPRCSHDVYCQLRRICGVTNTHRELSPISTRHLVDEYFDKLSILSGSKTGSHVGVISLLQSATSPDDEQDQGPLLLKLFQDCRKY